MRYKHVRFRGENGEKGGERRKYWRKGEERGGRKGEVKSMYSGEKGRERK